MSASPDDCSLALRGLQTLGVRLEAAERSALAIAEWLGQRPEVQTVLHPALPSCPGHEFWRRDFTGAAGLFSIVLKETVSMEQVSALVNALQLFKIGWSWGGVTSLVMAYPSSRRLSHDSGRVVRFFIGLEDKDDLAADLENALESSIRGMLEASQASL